MTTTAEQQEQTLHRAVAAVQAHYAAETPEQRRALARELELSMIAAHYDGVTPAQIASVAGLRQLWVAQLVPDGDRRAQALATARRDAQRYLREVEATMRMHARAMWYTANVDGAVRRGTKTHIAEALGISRVTLDAWLDTEEQQPRG